MDTELSKTEDDKQREEIATLLRQGLKTEVWPRAGTSQMVNDIVGKLQKAAGDELAEKLVIAGFTDHTISADGFEQPCETCMYYLAHRKFCDLPELMVAVEPEWSCRLWRI